jgi:hypothetical protein
VSAKETIYAQLPHTDNPVLQELKKNISAKSAVAMMSALFYSPLIKTMIDKIKVNTGIIRKVSAEYSIQQSCSRVMHRHHSFAG